MSVIIPRSAWGPRYDDGAGTIGVAAWHDIFVHHTVTRTGPDELAHMRLLEQIGETNFGQGISYTVVVFPSGNAYQGHSLTTRGAHTYQRNDSSRAIAFVGNFMEDTPTEAALRKAALVLKEWRGSGLPSTITGGHRDVYATSCPGDNLYDRLGYIQSLSYVDIPDPVKKHPTDGETMFVEVLTGPKTGAFGVVNGGLLSGLDSDSTGWAKETNSKAGGALLTGISTETWDDLVAKSKAQEGIKQAVLDNTVVLKKVLDELVKLNAK